MRKGFFWTVPDVNSGAALHCSLCRTVETTEQTKKRGAGGKQTGRFIVAVLLVLGCWTAVLPLLCYVFFFSVFLLLAVSVLSPPLSVSVFCPFFFDSLLSLLLCFHLQDLAVAVVVLVALGQTVVLLFLRFPCPLFLPSLLFFLLFSVLLMFLFSLCLLCSFSFFLPPSVLSMVSPLSVLCPPCFSKKSSASSQTVPLFFIPCFLLSIVSPPEKMFSSKQNLPLFFFSFLSPAHHPVFHPFLPVFIGGRVRGSPCPVQEHHHTLAISISISRPGPAVLSPFFKEGRSPLLERIRASFLIYRSIYR